MSAVADGYGKVILSDRIVREVRILYDIHSPDTIKKMWVRKKGESEFKEYVRYYDPDTDESFWGPWDAYG